MLTMFWCLIDMRMWTNTGHYLSRCTVITI